MYTGTFDDNRPDDLFYMEKGLGFAYKIIADSHFSERTREGRLIKLVLETDKTLLGIGPDEGMALLIQNVGLDTETAEVSTIISTGGIKRRKNEKTQQLFLVCNINLSIIRKNLSYNSSNDQESIYSSQESIL
jgi:cyanophycinase-like exopeptidase